MLVSKLKLEYNYCSKKRLRDTFKRFFLSFITSFLLKCLIFV